MFVSPPNWVEFAAVFIILALAAALRMGAPGITEFKRDEANLSYLALDMAHGRAFPLLGIDSSVGIRNAPMSVYIMALPYLFSADPTLATLFVGLLNVIAALLIYLLARRYYNSLSGVVAALLYAASPWAVIFSRKIWAQDLLPMFVLLTVGSGLLGFIEGKRWAQGLHLPLLAITGQIHYGAFVLIPITLFLILVGRQRLTRAFAISIGLAILVTLPYLIGLSNAGLLQPATLNKVVTAGGERPHAITLSGEAIHDAVLVATGIDFAASAAPHPDEAFTPPAANIPFGLLGLLIMVGALWLAARTLLRRDARTPIDIVLLIWLLFTPLVFSITWTDVYTHYFISMIPAAFLIVGALAADIWHELEVRANWRRAVFVSGAVLAAVLITVQVGSLTGLLNYVDTHNTPDGFATPLHYYLPIRQAVLEQHPAAVLAKLDGQYIGFHDEATLWNALLYGVPSVRFLDANIEVYAQENALYLSHRCTESTQNFQLRPGDATCYAISVRTPADFDAAAFAPVPNADHVKFASGARLLSYHWQTEPRLCLSLAWAVDGPAAEDYQVSVHFTDSQQHEIVFADGEFWRGRYWRRGDTVVRTFCPASDGEHQGQIVGVRVGMYTQVGAEFHNVDLLDASGASAGQSIEFVLKPQQGS